MNRSWRTNIGLRLTNEVGQWFENKCEDENRAMSNYIEYLIMREYKSEQKQALALTDGGE